MLALRRPAACKAVDAIGRVIERLGGGCHLVKGFRQRNALLREHLLVPVQDEVVDRPRQRMHLALVVLGKLQPAGGKIVHRKIGRGQVRVFHERGQVREPAGLFELPLLHVITDVNDVEARLAGRELDDGLLPLLLLRNDFGFKP